MNQASLQELLANNNLLFFVVHGLLALWGLIDCFFGFKLFKMTLAFFGLLFGVAVGLQLGGYFFPEQLAYLIGLSIAFGLVGVIFSYRLYKVGLFFLGAWLGIVLILPFISNYAEFSQTCIMGVSALICGMVTVFVLSYMIIIATAITGAFRLVFGVAFFQGGPNLLHLVQMNEPLTIGYTDKIVLISLSVGLLGLLLQLRYYRMTK